MDALCAFSPADAVVFAPQGAAFRAELVLKAAAGLSEAAGGGGGGGGEGGAAALVFKVKTNKAERYAVKPHLGLLEAGEARAISCASRRAAAGPLRAVSRAAAASPRAPFRPVSRARAAVCGRLSLASDLPRTHACSLRCVCVSTRARPPDPPTRRRAAPRRAAPPQSRWWTRSWTASWTT